MYKCCFKRIIDFCIAFVALSVLFLPLIIVSLWLRFANRGAGILFFQERPGKEGKIFRVIKFKTMTDERDTKGHPCYSQGCPITLRRYAISIDDVLTWK